MTLSDALLNVGQACSRIKASSTGNLFFYNVVLNSYVMVLWINCRQQNGLPIKASMGICIQRMVDAETAGVMFTRHPTTGDPSNIIITANYGLGEVMIN